MSSFTCPVVRLTIEPHHNADALEIARVGDYRAIVKKGEFETGHLAVYIPEASVLPESLLKKMGFWDEERSKGTLGGGSGNRVKPIKLRGVVSQGLIYPCDCLSAAQWVVTHTEGSSYHSLPVEEGQDASEFLGITKYEVPIPVHMKSKILGTGANLHVTHAYDFDNLKKMPDLFEDGEEVVITEKIHGTLMCVVVVPASLADENFHQGRGALTSKGMGSRGFLIDHNDPTNLYAQAAEQHGLLDAMVARFSNGADILQVPILLFGEVFGKTRSGAGVQDMTYSGGTLSFRAFDIALGNREKATFLHWHDMVSACRDMSIEHVPLLYKGPYNKDVVLEHTDGKTLIGDHIREGVVVKSTTEKQHQHYGRKIAKSVSDAYLFRKNATEYN